MVTLSMYDANDFVQSAMLDGQPYKLHYSWNEDAGQWTVDVLQNDNTEIVRGIVVVPNLPLFSFYRRYDLPLGELMAVVVNQDEEDNQTIGREDFLNGKFSMVYVPENEVNAILEASV